MRIYLGSRRLFSAHEAAKEARLHRYLGPFAYKTLIFSLAKAVFSIKGARMRIYLGSRRLFSAHEAAKEARLHRYLGPFAYKTLIFSLAKAVFHL